LASQYLNMGDPERAQKVYEKQRKSCKIRENIAVIIGCLLRNSRSTHIDYEQPVSCLSWCCPSLAGLLQQFHETKVDGCMYGVRCPHIQKLMKNPWRIISTDPRLPLTLNKRCSNRRGSPHNHEHELCEGGRRTSASASYPPALAKGWAKLIMLDDIEDLKSLCSWALQGEEIDEDPAEADDETLEDEPLSDQEHQTLHRLHRDLGHCQNRALAKFLQARGC